jgi:hypothetical protein
VINKEPKRPFGLMREDSKRREKAVRPQKKGLIDPRKLKK